MRSLALAALVGSFVASSTLVGQSLTEHGAAAAGATIGTAAGKPLGTAIGGIFGTVDKTAATAATPKTAKPVADKSAMAKPSPVTSPSPAAPQASSGSAATVSAPGGGGGHAVGAGGDAGGGSGAAGPSSGPSRHHVARRPQPEVQPQAVAAPIVPLVEQPVVREPTAQDAAKIRVGATASEVGTALGVPESKVSIPDENGHLVEICQYWAGGQPVATVRLDNGRVVSVKTAN